MADEKNKESNGYCSMCRRSERVTGRQIELPDGMRICPDCMQRSFDQFRGMDLSMEGLGELLRHLPDPAKMQEQRQNTTSQKEQASEDVEVSEEEQEDEKRFRQAEREMYDFQEIPRGFSFFRPARAPRKKQQEKPPMTLRDILPPHQIKAALDEYVIGQEQAKKVLSVGVYNHYKRILSEEKEGVAIEKSNILMIGPTGSGKTFLVQMLAGLLKVPLAMTDATSLTEAGYIGDDIESVVSKLLAAADNDVERAEHGIIFIDEIDKIAKKKNTNQRDVSGEAVQQGLLKLLEGSKVEVPVGATNKNAMVPLETVDTSHILFICGGAFPDLNEIVKERLNHTSSMGFLAELKDRYDREKNLLQQVCTDDLRSFGLIPEFIGRLPVLCVLESLTEDMLVNILKEPKNAIIKQYQRLLEIDEVRLTFEDEALREIAKIALERDTGARALRSILEEYMLDIMYEIPKDQNIGEVVITKEYILHCGGPRIHMRTATVG